MSEKKIITDNKLECDIVFFNDIDFSLESGEKLKNLKIAFKTFGKLNIEKTNANNWQKSILSHALIGEKKAFERLEFFIKDGLKNYKNGRNFPSQDNVSRLAPNFHFGEI